MYASSAGAFFDHFAGHFGLADDSPPSFFNTATVKITAPLEDVWVIFNDRSLWQESYGSKTLVSGKEGEIGAISELRPNVPGVPMRLEEIIYIADAERLVVRISVPGHDGFGHADFHSVPAVGGSRFTASIHTVMSASAKNDIQAMQEATQSVISAQMVQLKRACER
jgi:hypothetical protein